MFVKIVKGGKDRRFEYVHIVESVRDENGKPRQNLIKNLGRKDKLLEADPQAMEKLYEQYGGTRSQKDQRAATIRTNAAIEELQNSIDVREYPFVNIKYGHYVVRHIWRNVLEVTQHFVNIQNQSKAHFDIDETICFLTASKVLDPHSVLRTYDEQDRYLGAPVQDVPLNSLYDLFGTVKENKDSFIRWANQSLSKIVPKDRASLVFYDVTNTFFECSMTDYEKGHEQADFMENVIELTERDDIRQRLGSDCFDINGEVAIERLPDWFWEIVSEEKIQFLRMRGPSKEHRTDLPIVSIALVIDRYGFPMDFAVYAGNASEFKTMEKSIAGLKEKFHLQQSIVIADRGLNSQSNLSMLEQYGLGFLMAQKVTNLGKDITAKMLDESLYTPFNKDDEQVGRFQVIKNFRPQSSKENVDSTLVLMFHPKRYERDVAILNIWRDMVLAKAQAGVKVGPRKTGWACLAKVEGGNKERKICGIDEAVYAKKLALCGYSAIVYRPAPEAETKELPPNEIANTYHQLNQIEDCFRVMKSNLGLRPIYLWNTDHVKGHITICVLALMILRYIQWQLKAAGQRLSVHEICKALNDAELVCWKDQTGKVCLHPVIKGAGGVRVGREKMTTKRLLAEIKKEKKQPSNIDKIMTVCGLQPLVSTYTRNELARCLNTKFYSDEEMLSQLVLAQME